MHGSRHVACSKGKPMKSNPIRTLALFISLLSLLWIGSGCSEGTTAKLQFSNSNAVALDWKGQFKEWILPTAYAATVSSPTLFKMKVISAHLSEDVDPLSQNNVGNVSMFYLNPECREDTNRCNVNEGTAHDGQPYTNIITTFFDFSQGSDAVNAALGAQNREVEPGTYRYVRMDFCKGGTNGIPNAVWSGGPNAGDENTFATGMCGVTSVEMNPPLELADGDTVTVQLSYDYSESIQVGADAIGEHCVGAGATRTCFTIPEFVPSVIR